MHIAINLSKTYSFSLPITPQEVMRARSFILLLLFLTVNLLCLCQAEAASILNAINRSDETTSLQLFFHFDTLPEFKLRTKGRRVDIELNQTNPVRGLKLPASDGRLIRIVPKELPAKTIYSIYFRYPPQKVKTKPQVATGVILLDVLLGNQLSTSYPELTTRLQGVEVVRRSTIDSLNPVNITPYAHDWLSFFTTYELPVTITPPPVFHLPPFPLAQAVAPDETLDSWMPQEIQKRAAEGKWNQVCLLLREEVETQPKETLKERLVLAYAEGLLRLGEYRPPLFFFSSE